MSKIIIDGTEGVISLPVGLSDKGKIDTLYSPPHLTSYKCSKCKNELEFEFSDYLEIYLKPCMNCLMGDICE